MFIKLYYAEKIHKISKIPESFSDFVSKVKAIFSDVISLPSCILQYEDEEGDRIMLSDETDFKTMISIESHQQGNNTIKVFLVERKERCFGSGINKKSCLRKNSGSRSPKNQKRLTFDENIKIESNSTTREAAKATPKVEETKSSATSTNPKSGKTNSL
eukprot:CAMPEP_0114592434 /NCGR_PEP_ID=MMETSP0125-20121206/14263_1 /TAXON_ID=485358 ORGANISM="Aristerostoma sp., Strain ATCC 50986" /NCGR_SAMPLE_ID=MMETSP0125 /ASSEMBLY_ACC=CAM_ASM_000245 /LENGTH=158 /DNA_ID=CAMNT_0001791079 /DNA_START=106 /DNA_END=582 /DNA_ORIENTATION=+